MKDLHSNQKSFLSFLQRFHLVLFVVSTVLLLSVAIMLLNGIVGKASGIDSVAPDTTSSSFDQATIDRIEELRTSDEPSIPLDLSKGRINLFNE